jgi:hypothetical protein
VLVRALEWRAGWFRDPADRLQFLRRQAAQAGRRHDDRRITRERVRHGWRASVMIVTLLVALTNSRTTEILPGVARQEPTANSQVSANSQVPANSQIPNRQIWLVQTTPQFDLYSNGLRIEEQYATSTAPRRYVAFASAQSGPIASTAAWRTEPAGIVYHTTESHLSPFEENQNGSLQRAGEGLLEYVSHRRSYHFVIDRFGRVFRVVRESDYANHAGHSVWADQLWTYINLNQSFFGVAFEAHSRSAGLEPAVNAAQVYAGRILTAMLRARYGIPASNCVAHAQVSVNPANHGAGYHLDWAANLPFAELGLADNYKLALPSVELFGFQADAALAESSVAQGVDAAVAQVRRDAAAQDLPVGRYRETLQKRYRDAIQALRGKGAYQEYN